MNWRQDLDRELTERGESVSDIVHEVWATEDFYGDPVGGPDAEFEEGYGVVEGCPFTVWTSKRVYFPACYDGSEWVTSVPRDPCDEATFHVGG